MYPPELNLFIVPSYESFHLSTLDTLLRPIHVDHFSWALFRVFISRNQRAQSNIVPPVYWRRCARLSHATGIVSSGFLQSAEPNLIAPTRRREADSQSLSTKREHDSSSRGNASTDGGHALSTGRCTPGSTKALQMSSVRQGFPPTRTSDQAHSNAYRGEASWMSIPRLHETLQPIRRVDEAFKNPQQPEFETK